MSLNEMVENAGGRLEDKKVALDVNPNVTTDRGQEFYDQNNWGSFEDMNLKDKLLPTNTTKLSQLLTVMLS